MRAGLDPGSAATEASIGPRPPLVGPEKAKRFRPEIEGLRAVAALLVAAYHVWFGTVSGGVDVFFVVAGFMMTVTIVGHYERYGRLRIVVYLGRLMTRLLPNALVVLATVGLATVLFLPATQWKDVFAEIAASAAYVENWTLIDQSVDYLQRDDAVSPVQHYWAMSIQGQFYLLWIFVALLALVLRGKRTVDASMMVVMTAVFCASFAFSLYLTSENQPVAYFHTGTRVWEFAAGGLAALLLRRVRTVSEGTSLVLGWCGLALILTCGIALPVQDAFPGWVALWPVVGALFILVAGHSPLRWSASSVLSTPVLVRLGAVAYALYLWHWPVLIFYLRWTGDSEAGVVAGALVIAVSVLLAFVSTRLVERPLRAMASARRPATTVAIGVLAAALVAGGAVAVSAQENDRVETDGLVGAALVEESSEGGQLDLDVGTTANPVPGVVASAEDLPPLHEDGCLTLLTNVDVVTCEYGDVDAARTLVLTGGSHSAHWLPGLDLAAQEEGWRLVTLIKDGCRVGYVAPPQEDEAGLTTCSEWNVEAEQTLVELDPDLVLMTSTTSGRGERESVLDDYVSVWQELAERDIPVLAIRDTPRAEFNRVDCLVEHGALSPTCDVQRESTLNPVDPTTELTGVPDTVSFVDLNRYFCSGSVCPAVIGNAVVYSDRNHITATYSASLAQVLATELDTWSRDQ